MNGKQAALARKQLERRLEPLRKMTLDAPPHGWIRAIRESLGMTASQLATRMGVTPSRITVIEKAEAPGSTTLRTLREAAAALNCSFVYAFVPIEPLDAIVRARAAEKAGDDVARVDHTMRLENQALLAADLTAENERTIDALLSGSLRRLWEEPLDRDG